MSKNKKYIAIGILKDTEEIVKLSPVTYQREAHKVIDNLIYKPKELKKYSKTYVTTESVLEETINKALGQ